MRGRRSSPGSVECGCGNDAGDRANAFRWSVEGRFLESMVKALGVR